MRTRYVVLRASVDRENVASPKHWELLDAIDASSAEAAIRVFAEENGDGTYVAVPERSWTQRAVKVETKTRVVLGGAK